MSLQKLQLLIVLVILNGADSFYVPGVAPMDFNEGEPVEVKVSACLIDSSVRNRHRYYCKPI